MKLWIWTAILCIGSLAWNSCGEPLPSIALEQFLYLSLTGAKEVPAIKKLNMESLSDTAFYITMAYGGTTNYERGDISAVIEADVSLAASFNAANNTDYQPLPAEAYALDRTTIRIANGTNRSDAVKLTIRTNAVNPDFNYILPVTVKSVAGGNLPLSEEWKTLYLVFPEGDGKGPDDSPFLIGRWLFDDSNNILRAAVGSDLKQESKSGAVNITPVEGPSADNKAVRVAKGSYFIALPNIEANGGDGATKINEYTLLFDYRLPHDFGSYFCFLQTNPDNSDDGDVFIRPNGVLGTGTPGYSAAAVPDDKGWHRLLIVRSATAVKFFLDGVLFHDWTDKVSLDDRFAIDPRGVVLIGDDDGEDLDMDIAEIGFWSIPIPDGQAASLSMPGAEYPLLE